MITVGREIVVDYQDLIDEHGEIDRLSKYLETLARSSRPEPDRAQALLRELARVVGAHLRKEESFIYPGLASCTRRHDVTGLVAEFEALKRDWECYLETWQRIGALGQWRRFGADTLTMLTQLRERALAEVEQLYAMGLREGLVTLRPAVIAGGRDKRAGGRSVRDP